MATATETRACIGVVLAGGRSSRMGRDKALLTWHGHPLLDHQLQVLRDAGVDDVQVSGERVGHASIADRQPQSGPLGGIASVAAALHGEVDLLVIPVDMPRLQPQLLRRLREHPGAACMRLAGHVLPMRLRLDADTRKALSALMASPEPRTRSLRALQQRVGVSELPLQGEDASQLLDCNTPEQWREVHG
jgi:molybdenum cofactor guanylyltransferase